MIKNALLKALSVAQIAVIASFIGLAIYVGIVAININGTLIQAVQLILT